MSWSILLTYQLCSTRDIKSLFDGRKKGGRRNVLPPLVGDAVVSVIPAKGMRVQIKEEASVKNRENISTSFVRFLQSKLQRG